ncbi:PKD domain-containing protein, partial [Spongiivirga sp. MCCC 1A20706]|uniref:PKD domain-containing protein n=1 Tax=Spongiivirga sp. MCCC 1A20706 TaxID=3160963 RepID=UPI003977A8FA
SVTYRINDGTDFSNNATVTITINGVNSTNNPPVANAGPDQNLASGTTSFTLNGTGSSDPDGSITAYSWTQVSGPNVTIVNNTSASTNVTGAVAGTYVFQLEVTDNGIPGLTNTDTVQIIIDTPANQQPIAEAGPNQNLASGTTSFTLNGTGSSDPDGSITAYSWTKISGPNVTIVNNTSASTNVTGAVAGTYVFQLEVTDNGIPGLTDIDTVQIIINTPANQQPIAEAGPNQNLASGTTSFTLDGTGSSDPDGSITAYSWTQVSGPNVTIVNSTSASTNVTGAVAGTYVFQLEVTDNGTPGLTDIDTVEIAIDLPTFDFSLSTTISGTNNQGFAVNLDGGALFDNYTMSFQSNLSGTITYPLGSSNTFVAGQMITIPTADFSDGNWNFLYTANEFGTHNITITLSSTQASNMPFQSESIVFAMNNPPNAQNDTVGATSTNSTLLNVLSNDSDPDGDTLTISSVTQPQSGQGSVSIIGGNSISYTGSGYIGQTSFTYTVSDGNGGFDTATVTVNVIFDCTPPPGGCPPGQTFCFDTCSCENNTNPDGTPIICLQ